MDDVLHGNQYFISNPGARRNMEGDALQVWFAENTVHGMRFSVNVSALPVQMIGKESAPNLSGIVIDSINIFQRA
jgi:hypothetical protein